MLQKQSWGRGEKIWFYLEKKKKKIKKKSLNKNKADSVSLFYLCIHLFIYFILSVFISLFHFSDISQSYSGYCSSFKVQQYITNPEEKNTYLLHYSVHIQRTGHRGEIDRVRRIAVTGEKAEEEIYCSALKRRKHNSCLVWCLKYGELQTTYVGLYEQNKLLS